ncbi:hypothetical protein GGR50DRAFT_706394 [Xylaria sp. CBS 124048]|nr:hypothetical protein GGR50DRAFT_706394 [Xylaria sp. CBS 124048]
MRLNVATSELLAAGVMGLATACQVDLRSESGNTTDANPVISVENPPLTFGPRANETKIVLVKPDAVSISVVRLRSYNEAGVESGRDDKIVTDVTAPEVAPEAPGVSDADSDSALLSDKPQQDNAIESDLIRWDAEEETVIILWSNILNAPHIKQPLYLECEWNNGSAAGNTSTFLFSASCEDEDEDGSGPRIWPVENNTMFPARNERIQTFESAQSAQSIVSASVTAASIIPPFATAPAPASTPEISPPAVSAGGPASASSKEDAGGLSKDGVIGVAVGVTLGGLLILATLAWLFYTRRRHSKLSGVDKLTVPSKEMPGLLDPSPPPSRQSASAGRVPSDTPPFAPFADNAGRAPKARSLRKTATNMPLVSSSQMNPVGSLGTSAPAIDVRYLHLVEDGMSEEEIRRLEEEERQLDAAIESAGRNSNP